MYSYIEIPFEKKSQPLEVLVERKTLQSSENVELHFYETLTKAMKVNMSFDSPVIACMVKGNKKIRMNGLGEFQYLPGETLIIPSGEKIQIDFPTATLADPTQCLALVPEEKIIDEALYVYYESTKASDVKLSDQIKFSTDVLVKNASILNSVERMMKLFREKNPLRDTFIKMTTKELVLRILQSKAKRQFLQNFYNRENKRMSYIAQYIRENICKSITTEDLAKLANMGKSSFYNLFKNTFGITPRQFIIEERIALAKKLLVTNPNQSISALSYELGYSDSAHFSNQFKSVLGISPRQFVRKNK